MPPRIQAIVYPGSGGGEGGGDFGPAAPLQESLSLLLSDPARKSGGRASEPRARLVLPRTSADMAFGPLQDALAVRSTVRSAVLPYFSGTLPAPSRRENMAMVCARYLSDPLGLYEIWP